MPKSFSRYFYGFSVNHLINCLHFKENLIFPVLFWIMTPIPAWVFGKLACVSQSNPPRFRSVSGSLSQRHRTRTATRPLHWFIRKGSELLLVDRRRQQLTRVGFQHAARVSEVLGVLDNGNLCHSDDHGVGAHLGGWRGVVAIGDVMKGAGRVIVITDNRGRAWGKEEEKVGRNFILSWTAVTCLKSWWKGGEKKDRFQNSFVNTLQNCGLANSKMQLNNYTVCLALNSHTKYIEIFLKISIWKKWLFLL